MADISKIKLPNNTTYDIKDAKKSGVYNVIGTQTSSTENWTGNINIPALYDGLTIDYFLPYDSVASTSVTLNLTLSDGTTTGAKNVYYSGSSRLTTHYSEGMSIKMTYYSAGSISISGTATSDDRWIADANYNADIKVRQTRIATNYDRPLLMSSAQISSTTTNIDNVVYRNNDIYANPSTGTITATKFVGDISGGTNLSSTQVTGALGYTPYDSANPAGYTDNIGTVTQVKVGTTAYDPSSGVVSLPAYPTVNNATLTIQKNGSTVKTFTANASSNVTANITVPTSASDVGALPDTTKYALSDSVGGDALNSAKVGGYTIGTTSVGSASTGTAITADDITSWTTNTPTAVTKKTVVTSATFNTVVTGGSKTSIPNISKKTVVTGVTKKTVVTSASGATASYANGILTLTDGAFSTGDSCTVTTGDSVTVGTAIEAYTSLNTGVSGSCTTGDSCTVTAGTAATLKYTARSIPNISVTSTTVATATSS